MIMYTHLTIYNNINMLFIPLLDIFRKCPVMTQNPK